MTHLRILGLDCVAFMFCLCIRLRIYVCFFVGGKIRPYFVGLDFGTCVKKHKQKHKQNANENTNTFCNVCVCTCLWFMFYLCRENNSFILGK